MDLETLYKPTASSTGAAHILISKTRFVILHYHLFKNAGTTVSALLEKNFPGRFAFLHGERSDSSLTHQDLLHFLSADEQVRAVSSHHLHPPSPEVEGFVFFDVVSVRNPLDRLRSMYDFYRRSPEGDDELIVQSRKHDVAGFLRLLLDRFPHLVNNVQVNYFANGGRYTRPPDEWDLKRAVEVIRHSAVPVVTELFDLCAVSAEYFLQPAFGTLDFSHTPENVSPGRQSGLAERLKWFRKCCGASLYNGLLAANELDIKLLEIICKEVHRRFEQLPEAKKRLNDFRQRCERR